MGDIIGAAIRLTGLTITWDVFEFNDRKQGFGSTSV